MRQKHDSENLNMRTIEMYPEQVALVENDRSLANVYGLKANCPLNVLNVLDNFHCITGLPSDIAHDLFEEVASYVLTNVIKSFVSEGFFSLEDLNKSILSFKFSEVDKSNKPSKVGQVLSKLKISQSAAQMWCFVRFLPLLVGNKIPQNDRKWECILLLRDMLFYVCSPTLAREHILIMSDIIEEFHERNCFPEEDVKPKFHYTLHHLKLAQIFGPLVHLQTLRFEGKDNYFKELVFRTKNQKKTKKKNCKSLAERHQYYQCTINTDGHFLSDGNTYIHAGLYISGRFHTTEQYLGKTFQILTL